VAKSADAKKWVESGAASRLQYDRRGHRGRRDDRATKQTDDARDGGEQSGEP